MISQTIKIKSRKDYQLFLLTFILVSILIPISNTQAASTAATMGAQSAAICASAQAAVAMPPGILAVGSGPLYVADTGAKTISAQILCSTVGVGPGSSQRENFLNAFALFAVKIFFREITMSIVNWINTGFQGNPSFIEDPAGFLANDVDRTIGNFIEDSSLNFLCKPFQINVKLGLGLQYSPFQDKIGCRLTDILANSEDAYNNFVNGDFIGGGGWESWLSITTVPQNNQLGALLIAQSELDARINQQSVLRDGELKWSGGLLSMKSCTRTYKNNDGQVTGTEKYMGDPAFYILDNDGREVSNSSRAETNTAGHYVGTAQESCKVVTPGVAITDQLQNSTSWDLEAINLADDINEIVAALGNFVVTSLINKGFSQIDSTELSSDNPQWRSGVERLQSQLSSGAYNFAQNPSAGINTSISQLTGGGSGINNNGVDPGNSGSNNNQPTSTGDQALDQVKTTLINSVNAYLVPEQNYLSAYANVSNNATTTKNKLEAVIACYNTKLANNSLNLTTGERNVAEGLISQASSTIAVMNGLIATTSPNIVSSLAKVTSLQTIKNTLLTATTAAVINTASADLTAVAATLHTTTEIANAQTYSTNTLSQIIIPNMTAADSLQIQCNAFPVR